MIFSIFLGSVVKNCQNNAFDSTQNRCYFKKKTFTWKIHFNSTCFLFLSLVAVFSAHVLSPLDQFHQSFQLFLCWHIRVQCQHFRAQVFLSDFNFVMVTFTVSMFPLMEAVFVVAVVEFAFVLSPEVESSFSSMASAVFITGDMIIWYISISNQDVFLLKWKWRTCQNVSNNNDNDDDAY